MSLLVYVMLSSTHEPLDASTTQILHVILLGLLILTIVVNAVVIITSTKLIRATASHTTAAVDNGHLPYVRDLSATRIGNYRRIFVVNLCLSNLLNATFALLLQTVYSDLRNQRATMLQDRLEDRLQLPHSQSFQYHQPYYIGSHLQASSAVCSCRMVHILTLITLYIPFFSTACLAISLLMATFQRSNSTLSYRFPSDFASLMVCLVMNISVSTLFAVLWGTNFAFNQCAATFRPMMHADGTRQTILLSGACLAVVCTVVSVLVGWMTLRRLRVMHANHHCFITYFTIKDGLVFNSVVSLLPWLLQVPYVIVQGVNEILLATPVSVLAVITDQLATLSPLFTALAALTLLPDYNHQMQLFFGCTTHTTTTAIPQIVDDRNRDTLDNDQELETML